MSCSSTMQGPSASATTCSTVTKASRPLRPDFSATDLKVEWRVGPPPNDHGRGKGTRLPAEQTSGVEGKRGTVSVEIGAGSTKKQNKHYQKEYVKIKTMEIKSSTEKGS